MSIEKLLQSTVKAGGLELRLVPGRRIVIVTPAGEREVQGPEQTGPGIDQLLSAVMPPEARQSLASGQAEWRLQLPGVGAVQARVDMRPAGPVAAFRVGENGQPAPAPGAPVVSAAPAAAPAPPPASPAVSGASGDRAPMERLLRTLVEMKASDLHVSVGSPAMVRHDGEIKPLPGGGAVLTAEDTRRILWPIAPQRNREEFERRHDTDFAYEITGLARFRCNFFMDRKGLGGVFRVIPSKIITSEEMGLSREIMQLCHLSKGLVLVTGPTGSGKSTTLCALIDYINRNRTDHIITIEDPLEFVHENKKCLINQRQVGEHTDSFKDALRAALREDPDIVLVGEMRDLETVSIAIETAETGHLVFGTLHTSSAPSTVDRIIDQFPADRQGQIRVMLSESLKGVISQMLCKKIGGRPRARAGGAHRHPLGVEPHPRGEDLPDPLHHADGQEVRHVPHERELHRPREEEGGRAAGGLREGRRQGRALEQLQEEQHRHVVGACRTRRAGHGLTASRVPVPVVSVSRAGEPASVLSRAAELVAQGDLLIFPTDTLYALGGAALSAPAALRVRRAKGRDDGKALPVVAGDEAAARLLSRAWTPGMERLAAAFWPGPLTLVLAAAPSVPEEVSAGTGTVAVRVPGLAVTRALCLRAGPLISTSANRQGRDAPLTCAEAVAEVGEAAALALDGGPGSRLPSTLVDATGSAPRLLREGAVPWADVLRAWD